MRDSEHDNRQLIDKALLILRKGLIGFTKKHSVDTGSAATSSDVHPLLRFIWANWHLKFSSLMPRQARNLISECRDIRNDWAHQEPFSTQDTYCAVDTIFRLLDMVDAPERSLLQEVRAQLRGRLSGTQRFAAQLSRRHSRTNIQQVVNYLTSISPRSATNSEILEATGVTPHQQVFQITQKLRKTGQLHARQVRRTWHFSVIPQPTQGAEVTPTVMTPQQFEELARSQMSIHFGAELKKGSFPGVSREFDMVSKDGEIAGDAKYYTMVGRTKAPPAKLATISEYVLLLRDTSAKRKFLVFGNQVEVPRLWLKKFGNQRGDVRFFFLDENGRLEEL